MILSNDTIIKPSYEITSLILHLISEISVKIGIVRSAHLNKPSPQLRKQNRVKAIQSSLEIEGNTLSEEQITALIENKRVLGPEKDIREVQNAIDVYAKLSQFKSYSSSHFLRAHKLLMRDLVSEAGKYRSKSVGIVKGSKVSHLAPPASNLKFLMNELFAYIKQSDDHPLIKSCVVHYEIEFIHPFMDGNGRMGRLWQTIILKEKYPIFEFLPFETIIKSRQKEYYKALEASDKEGKSTQFIAFILSAIDASLEELLQHQIKKQTTEERILYFIEFSGRKTFSRKDYLQFFKEISSATASRDLRFGTENELFFKEGDKRNTVYKINPK